MNFQLLTDHLLDAFKSEIDFSSMEHIQSLKREELQVNAFDFYKSVSSVYSSKIEGENIDFDSYYKHKFLNVEFKPDYTQRADDLFKAYEFIEKHELNLNNLQTAHAILSQHFLPKSQQGNIRNNPMFVINQDDKIEYVAASQYILESELDKLFSDINLLKNESLSVEEIFYYAALIHLVFVKIHPFQDGNGRTARLLEKWFLISKLKQDAQAIQLEKNYYLKRKEYYENIRAIGLEYNTLDYSKALNFLIMTIGMFSN